MVRTFVAALALSALAVACGPREQIPRPNVVLIVVDTLRKDHLSCYGYERETSPNIDRLAADGTRYDLAIAQAPWTTPSIGSLLTSQYPSSIGVRSMRSVLEDDLVLLPEVLQENGYVTGAVVSHSFCSRRWNFDQGFDEFDESNVQGHAAVTSPGVTAKAIEFVERHQDEPFFLWVHYFDPHFAFIEHESHAFGDGSAYEGPIEDGMKFSALNALRKKLTPGDVDEVRRLYDSEIAFTDAHIGVFFDRLRALDLYDNTVVVFTADHGEEFLDHGKIGHAKTLYQELVGVPLIVKAANLPRGVVDRPVPLLDVFPTVLEAVGIDPDPSLEGRSLFEPADPARYVFSETSRAGGVRTCIQDRYKVIQHIRKGRYEFYDLADDPLERRPLAPREVESLEELRGGLEHFEQRLEATSRDGAEIELSPEELEHLGALGYTGDED